MPRAAILHPDLTFSIAPISHPALLRGEICIRIEYATLCSSDLHTAAGRREEPLPTVLGHEACGFIEQIEGDRLVTDVFGNELKNGDRVTWAVFANDADSQSIAAATEQKYPGTIKYGHLPFTEEAPLTGALATHMVLKSGSRIAKVSHDIQAKALAPVNCSLATICGAFRLAGSVADKKVAVIGGGMLGLHAAMIAKASGALAVAVVDPVEERAAKAADFGADLCCKNALELETGAWDVIIETSGKTQAMEDSVKLACTGARIVWVGAVYPQANVQLNGEQIVRRLLCIRGLHNYTTADFCKAVEWIHALHKRYPLADLCGATYSLEQVTEAFADASHHRAHRVGICPA